MEERISMKEKPPQPHDKDCKCDRCEAERSSKAWQETVKRATQSNTVKRSQ